MNRRSAVFSFLAVSAAIVAPRPGQSAALPTVVVYRNPGCGCCEGWVKIPAELASCHIAFADGYAFEGHIPPADIVRVLGERPPGALGLVVPGMPVGSPGMGPEGSGDPYDVLLLKANTAPTVYSSH